MIKVGARLGSDDQGGGWTSLGSDGQGGAGLD